MESICRVLFQGDRHACDQYDVLFFHVILNGVKDPTEELTVHILFTLVVGYFACAQYDVRSPIGTSCHFPRRRKRVLFYCLCERSEANSREGGKKIRYSVNAE